VERAARRVWVAQAEEIVRGVRLQTAEDLARAAAETEMETGSSTVVVGRSPLRVRCHPGMAACNCHRPDRAPCLWGNHCLEGVEVGEPPNARR
jgi:hypothetical protein